MAKNGRLKYVVNWREYDTEQMFWVWHDVKYHTKKEMENAISVLQKNGNVNRIVKYRVEIVKGVATFGGDK